MSAVKQIPHEHFIVALSALVMALSVVIFASYPAGAEPNAGNRAQARVFCEDSDQMDTTSRGTSVLFKANPQNSALKTAIVEKTDVCIGRRTVREYYCDRNNTGIASKIIACAKDLICDNGACIKPSPLPTASASSSDVGG